MAQRKSSTSRSPILKTSFSSQLGDMTSTFKGRAGFGGLTNRPWGMKPIIAAVNGMAYGGGPDSLLSPLKN